MHKKGKKNVKKYCIECSMACTMPYPESEKCRLDVVRKLLSNFEMKVIDPNGKEVALGETGEFCIRSPTIMMGYLSRPESTAEAIDDEGWYHTGLSFCQKKVITLTYRRCCQN